MRTNVPPCPAGPRLYETLFKPGGAAYRWTLCCPADDHENIIVLPRDVMSNRWTQAVEKAKKKAVAKAELARLKATARQVGS